MSQHSHSHGMNDGSEAAHGSLKSYVIGFILSLILTIIPLVVILNHMVKGTGALVVLLVTAVLQFLVQLLFFMHLREEEKPRWNLMALILGIFIVMVIVFGSVWIMEYNKIV